MFTLQCGMCDAVRVCYIGERLIAKDRAWNKEHNMWECSKQIANETSQLNFLYCNNLTAEMKPTDPDCIYFRKHKVGLRRGIPGLPSGVFYSKFIGHNHLCWIICFSKQRHSVVCSYFIIFLHVFLLYKST